MRSCFGGAGGGGGGEGGGMVITKGSTWCAHRKIGITAPNGTNLGEAKLHLTPKYTILNSENQIIVPYLFE